MTTMWSAMIGVFLGFVFGVGCALAVMYSIYAGGYRASVKDSRLPDVPERYRKALAKLKADSLAAREPERPVAPSK